MAAVAQALDNSNVTSIKSLAESKALNSVPSAYAFNLNPSEEADQMTLSLPIPLLTCLLLTSGSPDDRAKIIHDLVKICQEWGFFIAVNRGVPESLMKDMIDAYHGFFSLPDEEKKEFKSGNDVLEMFKYGTSYNLALDKVLLWRDFFKVRTHPEFYSLYKPASFRILDPPLPQPEHAIGIPHHTDHGLVTLLIQNEMNGLQVEHYGKWLTVNGPKNGFFVNLADQMQILTNGKYNSTVMHRATVNNIATRISIAIPHGPSVDTIIAPAPELCDRDGEAPKYLAMNYKEYIQLQQSGKNYMKSTFDHIRA